MSTIRNMPTTISHALSQRSRVIGLTASFKTDPKTFADNRQLQKIDTFDWQIVFGRRGAGKTMLLATYARYITQQDDMSSASIELSVPDFITVVKRADERKNHPADLAQIYFADFIRCIGDHLYNVFSEANSDSKFWRFHLRSSKKKKIEDIILQIKTSTVDHSWTPIGSVKKADVTNSIGNSTNRSHLSKIGAELATSAVDIPDVSIGIRAGQQSGREDHAATSINDSEGLANFKFDYAQTRGLIEQLLDELGLEKIYLFIDEWSELDRTGASDIQPYFADLLKRVFWRNPRFTIKIGAIRNQTRLSKVSADCGLIGLELSADIFEMNLDSSYFSDDEERFSFFEEIVFRHLAYCNPQLLDFQQRTQISPYGTFYGRPVDTFITYIFRSRSTFKTLVTGSGFLPRDFIEMFDDIARQKHFLVTPPWSNSDIKSAIRSHFINHKHSSLKSEPFLRNICDLIMKKVRSNNSRLIAVNNTNNNDLLYGIAELYHRRFLHDISSIDVPSSLRNRFTFFYADLGLQYDASIERFQDTSDHHETFPLNEDASEIDVARYIL